MSTPSSRPSRSEPNARSANGAGWLLALTIIASGAAGCGEDEVAPTDEPLEAREVSGLRVMTRDGLLSAVIPGSFVVHRLTASLVAAPADGSGRIYLGRQTDRTVAAALGAHKDDVLGLGAEIVEERHFERATRLVADEGLRPERQRRRTWLVDDGAGGVILCEGFFHPDDEISWIRLIDAVCLEARPAPAAAPPAPPAPPAPSRAPDAP